MKQLCMFGAEQEQEQKYSTKIETPVYAPKNIKPHILTLCDDSKAKALLREINDSDLPEDEKSFLRLAAYRHCVFHYERIADYYAHSSAETQRFFERSALVIIDFEKAIEGGYVKLCEDIKTQFLEEYANELSE